MNQPPVEPPSGPGSPSELTAEQGDAKTDVCADEWFLSGPSLPTQNACGPCPDPFAGPPDEGDAAG